MNTQNHHFQKLTPINDANLGIYEDALEYAFSNDDVCNIAISGAYGAGKSSVIETYKKKRPDRKFLHISLAHFTDMGMEEAISETDLEGKIINQLVHQVSSDKIPQTKFMMKKEPDEDFVQKKTWFAVIFVLLLCFLVFHNAWCALVNELSWSLLKNLLKFSTTREMQLLVGILCVGMLALLCYQLMKRQMNWNILKKVNVKSSIFDIELFNQEEDSYFDKYLNEVLYLFESVNADGIVFEDLDRYQCNLIFEKLREINTLLNRRIQMLGGKEKKPIRFIYQMRDDMFLTKERTKFFDFIIPIVPVVDGSNALDKFLDYFTQSGIVDLFNRDFLQDLSLYVDDMRILKNICNEFLVYHEKLQESPVERDDNKLLAMITYKNIFPKDFANLQVARGYVYHLFDAKEQLIQNEAVKIQNNIHELEEEERQAAEEQSRNMDELDALYFVDSRPIKVDGKTEDEFQGRAEFVAAIKKNNYDVLLGTPEYYTYDYKWKKANIKDRFDALASNPEYAARKKNIENKEYDQKNKRSVQLIKYRRKLENIQMSYLKDLITKENRDAVFEAPFGEKVNGVEEYESMRKDTYFPLIRYLIINGYLDETYPDYMTFFYENSISKQDKIFLRSIREGKAKGPEHPLQNTEVVIKRMRLVDFDKEECLNYALLDELLLKPNQYREQLRRMMLCLYNREPVEFVKGYLRRGRNLREFTEHLNEVWQGACLWILEEEQFSQEERKQYLWYTLIKGDEDVLTACNYENELTTYISQDSNFLTIEDREKDVLSEEEKDDLTESLFELNVEFTSIDMDMADEVLLRQVYQKELYELNPEMITQFLLRMYQIPFSGMYLSQRLTLIFSQDQPMAEYVKKRLIDYIRMQMKEGGLLEESVDTVLYVLNDENPDLGLKVGFIQMLVTKLPKLSAVENKELWKELLVKNVAYTRENLLDYFYLSGNGMDEKLTAYINAYEGRLALDDTDVEKQYGEKAKNEFFWVVVKNNELAQEKYLQILNALNLRINIISTPIAQDKMQILVRENILNMTIDNLHFLRENYKNLVPEFIKRNTGEYLELISEEELVPEEVAYVLDMEVADASKIKLLELDHNPISVMHKKYSEDVTTHILQHNLDEEEKDWLYHWYPDTMPKVQEVIRQIALKDKKEIVAENKHLNPLLLDCLLKEEEIVLEDKKYLLANALQKLSKQKVREYLRLLNLQDFDDLFEGKRPTFDVTESNHALLTAFNNRGWISSFDVDKEDSSLYRAYGRKENPKGIKVG